MLNVYDYVANNNFFKKFEVDDLLFVQYRCLIKESPVSYWTHSNYFVYILAGSKRWICPDRQYILGAGEALFIPRGAYVIDRLDNEDFCALLIFLTDDFIKSILDKYPAGISSTSATDEESDSVMRLVVDDVMSAYFQSVLSYFPNSVSPPKELLKIKFEELILNILNSPANKSLASHMRRCYQNGKVSIRQVMETSFMHNMSMEEYARMCARSLSTFKSDFQEIYKTTPGKWLLDMRLHYAKCLIEMSDESINDIAFKSGFKNTTHFVRVFKDRYKMPPLQYRFHAQETQRVEV